MRGCDQVDVSERGVAEISSGSTYIVMWHTHSKEEGSLGFE